MENSFGGFHGRQQKYNWKKTKKCLSFKTLIIGEGKDGKVIFCIERIYLYCFMENLLGLDLEKLFAFENYKFDTITIFNITKDLLIVY